MLARVRAWTVVTGDPAVDLGPRSDGPRSEGPLGPDEVAAYLRAHPAFLAENPALYRFLAPPIRVHGDRFADHMAAMLRAVREHAAAMAAQADGVLAAGRAAAGLAARVQEAVLALLRSHDPIDCATSELPALLAVDAVSLCADAAEPGMRLLPAGTVEALTGGRGVVFRSSAQMAPAEARLLHGEAAPLARHDALVRIPGEGVPMLMALVARDPGTLDAGQGAGALIFLGRAMAAALGR